MHEVDTGALEEAAQEDHFSRQLQIQSELGGLKAYPAITKIKSHGWKPGSLNYVYVTARDGANLIDFLTRDGLVVQHQGSPRLLVTRVLSDLLVTADSLERYNGLALCTVDMHCLDISKDYQRGHLNSIGCYNIGS